MFPDAPTERGLKHINELTRCLGEGFETSATAGIFNVAHLCSAVYFGIRHKSVGAGYETPLNDIFIVHDITRNKTVSEAGCVFGILFLPAKHLKTQSGPTNRAGQSCRPAY